MNNLLISFNDLEVIAKSVKYKKIFIVTGKESFYKTGADRIIEKIIPKKKIVFFNDFTVNPQIKEILNGVNLFKSEKCDLIIAIGGGSVIDTAKLINVISAQDFSIKDFDICSFNVKNKGIPLVAIPTTSGTGSEATQFATFYINNNKHSVDHQFVLPSYVILHSPLTHSISKFTTAITALDTLCQSIESYWSINSNTNSLKFARKSIELGLNVIESVVNFPNNKNRNIMMQAAHFSGKAINISRTTLCHAISYPITSHYNIPHGHAVSLTIGKVLEYNDNITEHDCNDKRGVDFVKKKIDDINKMFKCNSTKDTKIKIEKIMNNINVTYDLKKLNIKNIDLIADECLKSNRANNNPRTINKKELLLILKN